MNNNNLSIIRQQFAQCVFTHKIHEKAADRLWRRELSIKWVNFGLWGVAVSLLFLELKCSTNFSLSFISLSISVFELLFTIFQKESPFWEDANSHKKIALQYLSLRDKYKNFIADIMNGLSETDIIAKRDLLQEQYQIINQLALQTTFQDYKEAQRSLLGGNNSDEEFTRSDREINRFLPKELHL